LLPDLGPLTLNLAYSYLPLAALVATAFIESNGDPCEAFERNLDGSWTSRRWFSMKTVAAPPVRVAPGVTFRRGVPFLGYDVAGWLDEHCGGGH